MDYKRQDETRWGVIDHIGLWAQYRAVEEAARDTFNDPDACALVQHVGKEEYTIVAEKPCCPEHQKRWIQKRKL